MVFDFHLFLHFCHKWIRKITSISAWGIQINLIFLNGPTPPLFVYFRHFQVPFYRKNCRLQQDSTRIVGVEVEYADHHSPGRYYNKHISTRVTTLKWSVKTQHSMYMLYVRKDIYMSRLLVGLAWHACVDC